MLLVDYRRLETNYRSHLQESDSLSTVLIVFENNTKLF